MHPCGVTKVDVNKQTALFYECKRRTPAVMNTNEQENPFPILHLKLADTTHMLAVWENRETVPDAAVVGDKQESMIRTLLGTGRI